MPSISVVDMGPETAWYVGTCTHVGESDEIDACARRRLAWLERMHAHGVRAKVAIVAGDPAGFAYVMPTHLSPWGPLGEDLAVLPCLFVEQKARGLGAGRVLVAACEEEARRQRMRGIATIAYFSDFWFMPAPFFTRLGYEVADRRDDEAVLWKAFEEDSRLVQPGLRPPRLLRPSYTFTPEPGKVTVDLFWNTFCQTSSMEAQRVREVAAEFGDNVVLREYCADDRDVLRRWQIPRAIFVQGREIAWGYEAPREGIRDAIARAITATGRTGAGDRESRRQINPRRPGVEAPDEPPGNRGREDGSS